MPKKKVILLMALLFFSMSIPALALQIGYVDFEFLFLAHPEYPIKSQEYRNILEQYVQEYQAAAAEITDGDELDNLITYYDTKAFEADEELSSFIVKSLKDFIAKVAKANNVDLVLAKNIVVYGGINLTKQVVEEMYHFYGISVPSYLRLE